MHDKQHYFDQISSQRVTLSIFHLFILFCAATLAACTQTNQQEPIAIRPTTTPTAVTRPTKQPTAVFPTTAVVETAVSTTIPNTTTATTTPIPTLTPTATPTVEPTPEPTPTLPSLPHDLLFIEDRNIFRLNSETHQRELLLEASNIPIAETTSDKAIIRILRFVLTSDEQTLLVESRRNGDYLAQVDAFNLQGEWLYNVVPVTQTLINLLVAPNGQHILYIPQDTVASGPIMMQSLTETAVAQQVGYCGPNTSRYIQECNYIQWSPDSRFILGEDGNGLWRITVADYTIERVAEHHIPSDGITERYSLPQAPQPGQFWSPSGRYARLAYPSDGNSYPLRLLDIETKAIIDLPEPPAYYSIAFVWLSDDRILSIRSSLETFFGDAPATIKIWRLDPQQQQFQLEQTVDITSHVPLKLVHQANGTILILSSSPDEVRKGIWLLSNLDTLDQPVQIDDFKWERFGDSNWQGRLWSTSGDVGLIVENKQEKRAFIVAEQKWVDLTNYISHGASNFWWLDE